MKRLALTLALLSITAFSMMAVSAFSDDPADKKIDRKYAKSFVGEDLNRKNFSKQNLDNSNFEDADLTGTNFEGSSMKNCNFRGATMKETRLMECDLTGSDFREASLTYPSLSRAVLNKVNFEGLDLSTLQFNELKVRGANFRDVKGVWCIYGSDFFEADLRGANFTKALESSSLATFRKAKYDQFTRWHDGFDPKARGAVYAESKEEPAKSEVKPKNDQAGTEAAFAKLDGNKDGVLSGKETATCKDCDTNKDGEVTLAEFLARK